MRPLSEATARVSSQNFQRKFVALGRIAENWAEIMGASMADKAFPTRLYYRKPKTKGEPPRTILYVAASDAHATTLHYQKGVMLERINHIFGEQWIQDIKFVAASDIVALEKHQRYNPEALSSEAEDVLVETLADIEDEDIRNALKNLGEDIFRNQS